MGTYRYTKFYIHIYTKVTCLSELYAKLKVFLNVKSKGAMKKMGCRFKNIEPQTAWLKRSGCVKLFLDCKLIRKSKTEFVYYRR